MSEGLTICAMRFWFARNSEVPIREQIVTQVVLGILSRELKPGERLPSTRDLARRFHLHPNTVSAAYRQLRRTRWVASRRGSGVYVRKGKRESELPPSLALDRLIANLLRSAREMGAPLSALHSRLRRWLALQPPDHFLVIEPDGELRRIVVAELQCAVKLRVRPAEFVDETIHAQLEGAIPVVLPSKSDVVRQALAPGAELLTLQLRSVPASLGEWLPAPSNVLLGVASRWPGFLKSARTMLIAAGFEAESLVFLDARDSGWQDRAKSLAAVVCDSVTASELPKRYRAIPFPLVAESSLEELRKYQKFITDPVNGSL
jgi:DNA-binding transcriptional regulator YhcF (GntR family)